MKIAEIRKKSLVVICSNNERTVVARYEDENGTYIFNEELKKEYLISRSGNVYDATYLGS